MKEQIVFSFSGKEQYSKFLDMLGEMCVSNPNLLVKDCMEELRKISAACGASSVSVSKV